MEKLRKIASLAYDKFLVKEGNEHIASEFALYGLLKAIHSKKPKSVLEIGLGIGSICYTVLYAQEEGLIQKLNYVGTENNEYCLRQLAINLQDIKEPYTICHHLQELENMRFDFIIVDGADPGFTALHKLINNQTTIFIEGLRDEQIQVIKRLLTGMPYIYSKTICYNRNYQFRSINKSFLGGYTLFILHPTYLDQLKLLYMKIVNKVNFWIYQRRKPTKYSSPKSSVPTLQQ